MSWVFTKKKKKKEKKRKRTEEKEKKKENFKGNAKRKGVLVWLRAQCRDEADIVVM